MRRRVHSCRRLAAFCEELAAAEEEHVLGYDYWVRHDLCCHVADVDSNQHVGLMGC